MELKDLLDKAKATWDAMSQEERQLMNLDQRRSWVRGELMLAHPEMTFEEADRRARAAEGVVAVKLGPTGDFPRGKFNADDEGGLTIAVGTKDKTLIIEFGTPTKWIGVPKAEALAFANLIRKHAETL